MPAIKTVGAVVAKLSNAPWWVFAGILAYLFMQLAIVALQSVFPQESRDRAAWWSERREYKRMRLQEQADETAPATRCHPD